MEETVIVVSAVPLPDMPEGVPVRVELTPRVEGLIRSKRVRKIDEPEPVPDLVVDVRWWVGGDLSRARAALEVERNRPQGPRPTLVGWLSDVISPQKPQDDPHGPQDPAGSNHTGGMGGGFTGHSEQSG